MGLASQWANQSLLYEKVADFSLNNDNISNAISMVSFAMAYRTAAFQLFGLLDQMSGSASSTELTSPNERAHDR